tara:strand:+ start:6163 stop:7179 length:1017 start_codon:yes stop_codon:yes gene_type:complete
MITIMTLNEKFYKKDKNGKLEYATLFDTDTKDEKEINILDNKKSNKQQSNKQQLPKLQMIDSKSFEYKYIKQGSILIKLCRTQFGMNFRYFYIDNMNYALRWFSPNKKYESSCIKLANIVKIKKATKNMLKEFPGGVYLNSNIYKLSIKISYYNDKNKPEFLYLVCKNKLEQLIWLCGLGNLIDNNRCDDKYDLESYTEYLNDDIYQYSDICNLFYYIDDKEEILTFKIYITQQSKKKKKLMEKIKNIEDIKDMNDEIKYYIIPQLNHIQKLISNVCSFINANSYRKFSKNENENIFILITQIEIKSKVSREIFKVLSKKYKKQIKKNKTKKKFEKYY